MSYSAGLLNGAAHDAHDALIESLRGLDRVIARALAAAPAVYGWESGRVQFRGLFISEEDVTHLLARAPGTPAFDADLDLGLGGSPLAALADRHDLTPFDQAVMLVALAPEIDLRYERLYAFLQDDVTRRRPSVDLILNLLCADGREKLARRAHFAADAPLVRNRLILLNADTDGGPAASRPPLLARTVTLDEQIVHLLLDDAGLDSRLATCAVRIPIANANAPTPLVSLPLPDGHAAALERLAIRSRETGEPLRLLFHGDPMPLKRRTAEAVAYEAASSRLLAVDLARLSRDRELSEILRVICSDAQRSQAVLFIDADAYAPAAEEQDRRAMFASALDTIAQQNVSAIVAAPTAWATAATAERAASEFVHVAFTPPSFAVRRTLWQTQADAAAIKLTDADLTALAGRFRLHPDQIETVVTTARAQAHWHGEPTAATHLFAAARAQSGQPLATLARKIEPIFSWDDLILPPAVSRHLHALCGRVAHRHRVLEDWGFERTLPLGKGVTALFAGPSGVGKTMAAEVVARELQLDLYKIDLSGIVSKYIGETEKNLERVFLAAEGASAILFFDEADALFGKRSEVRDSHDRYANLEISYLLQKMEAYDGVAILASNLRQHLDDAFVRRLAFTIHFPFPDQAHREKIWTAVWPAAAPLARDVDLAWLAAQFKLSGGHIKNVALAAAFLAAEDDSAIAMRHVFAALEREYQKMGKPLDLPALEVVS